MNVFELRERLVGDYSDYTRSFVTVRDERVRTLVERELGSGLLWPDPIIQLNPAFEPGEWIDELAESGLIHEECRKIFRLKSSQQDTGRPLRLHRHQADAVRVARTAANFVLTTGTGSGKSLSYFIPIVDHVLRHGSGRGIQAIVVYPMNALANSQAGELEKFLTFGYADGAGPVTFRRYTGQERDDEREEIIARPPDILLTNYVMLELILTRPFERRLVEAAQGLRFLVFDELHTYRGRQGADVALLARRVREACDAHQLQCIGTSATLAGAGTLEEQQSEVASVASLLFGAPVAPGAVISETLRRETPVSPDDDPAFRAALRERVVDPTWVPPRGYDEYRMDPLASWIESTFGLTEDKTSNRLVRARPRPITGDTGAAKDLAGITGTEEEAAATAIRKMLLAGFMRTHPETGFPVFAFRLHQFFSRGETVYASLEPESTRYLTTRAQQFVPGDRNRVLVPLAFCRECGQEYYTVRLEVHPTSGARFFTPRELADMFEDSTTATGFLYASTDQPWPEAGDAMLDRLPDEWIEEVGDQRRVKRDYRKNVPQPLVLSPVGREAADGVQFHFVPAPFRFCLRCGISYSGRQPRDFAKLATLGAGGRATATTTLCLTAIRSLRADESLSERARKLLSFTDNRQDASLQAGHFNDFVEVGLLRSALLRAAAAAGDAGLRHEELTQRVFESLALPIELYARDPDVRYQAREETDRALRDVLGYRLYRDLERGWRITAPNLEQTGLLRIEYVSLDELCADEKVWSESHAVLAGANSAHRARAARVLLDYMRRELAVDVDYLSTNYQEQLRLRSSQHLIAPWAIDEQEQLEHAAILFPRPRRRAAEEYRGYVYVSARGGFGQFLRRPKTFEFNSGRITLDDTDVIIRDLLEALRVAGVVTIASDPRSADDVAGYRVPAAAMRWLAGDGSEPYHDPIRVPRVPEERREPNRFFVDFYRRVAADGRGLEAKEHTAQVPATEREQRELRFREARLPILFCSPTMELGVDIAELNVVNMRNVPPTPANYAQRSGRAGRSGQPALVFNYCASGNSHDQYFFRRPQLMVSGQVRPPRLDLANEDLLRAHVHAVWLGETGASLKSSLADVLDIEGSQPTLHLRDSLRSSLASSEARQRALVRCERILATIPNLSEAEWYSPRWLADVLDAAPLALDQTAARWRELYQAALEAQAAQNIIANDASRSQRDREQARRLRAEAEAQLELLRGDIEGSLYQSDFYSYRYFASEGFLPGYNFPRLPLSAFIPGRRAAGRDEFLSRPRFLAISEFGPRSVVYHEGSRYIINKVILPVSGRSDENRLVTQAAKQCAACGYLHPIASPPGPDLCERCRSPLPQPIERLFRLQNVATRRRDRINSDEEERLRQGFEIRTGVRFPEHAGQPAQRTASVRSNGIEFARLAYASAATLWRVNVGWTRRADKDRLGFALDTERGYWARNEQAIVEDPDDPMSGSTERVIPYVEDRRNALLFEPSEALGESEMASLTAALKNAIQVHFQLEESELIAEPLPGRDTRRLILLYEAAEGGAGVLRRLVTEPQALSDIARAALELCHFDPSTGDDLDRADGVREPCEAACYDCLMSYVNQLDHKLLDRQSIRGLLLALAAATVESSPSAQTRDEHLARLLNQCESDLERRWLRFLDSRRLALPTHAQHLLAAHGARPDFLYEDEQTVVFIDGPIHNYADVAARDGAATERLEDAGYTVIRFGVNDADWLESITRWPSIFGTPS